MEHRASPNPIRIPSTTIVGIDEDMCPIEVLRGLASAAIQTRWRENYTMLLHEMVFSQHIPQLDEKQAKHHQKLLVVRPLNEDDIWQDCDPGAA